MTQDKMQVAAAEWLGWTQIDTYIGSNKLKHGVLKGFSLANLGNLKEIPPLDRNTLHECLVKMTAEQWHKFCDGFVGDLDTSMCTTYAELYLTSPLETLYARFLKTVGLWKE